MRKMSPEAKEVLDRLAGRDSLKEALDRLEKNLAPIATKAVEGVIGKNLVAPFIGAALIYLGVDSLRRRFEN